MTVLPCQDLTHHLPFSFSWRSPRLSGEMLHISNWSKLVVKSLENVYLVHLLRKKISMAMFRKTPTYVLVRRVLPFVQKPSAPDPYPRSANSVIKYFRPNDNTNIYTFSNQIYVYHLYLIEENLYDIHHSPSASKLRPILSFS